MNTSGPKKNVKVDVVVQDYMDSLLADLFPDIQDEIEEPPQLHATDIDTVISEPDLQPPINIVEQGEALIPATAIPETLSAAPPNEALPERPLSSAESPAKAVEQVALSVTEEVPPVIGDLTIETPEVETPVIVPPEIAVEDVLTKTELIEERAYPNAPVWAQQAFDVLLFDVCGLKLAVCMESLGRIIKVEQELNQLIGRPPWFMGAYCENEQNLYVVDTAKFIMPEKGYDLAEQGFEFIIQLQRSHWSLACKEVYRTVRLQPDQVKWRSSEGKRPWLAGTVIEQMCALVHVDSLVELLENENK
jgi:purine-binding chemotaxis protein CheW